MRNTRLTLCAAVALTSLFMAGCSDGYDSSNSVITTLPTPTSFVDPSATLTGAVTIGSSVYVAPFARLDAQQSQITVGNQSDVQDSVTLTGQVALGERVLLAHGCTILGPAQLGTTGGTPCFVGFNAQVDGATIEPGAMVGILARVGPGVTLHTGKKVLAGRNVTTQEQADDPTLGKVDTVTDADRTFMQGVLTVNLDLATGYVNLQASDPSSVTGIGPDPNTPIHPEEVLPVLAGVSTSNPAYGNRLIGQLVFGDSFNTLMSLLGQRDSVRADEGGPFTFGTGNSMENEVTVHALEHSSISVGNNCHFSLHCVLHGGEDVGSTPPEVTTMGSGINVGSRAVVFRSTIGDNCTIGANALVDGCQLSPGTVVPPGTILIQNVSSGSIEW